MRVLINHLQPSALPLSYDGFLFVASRCDSLSSLSFFVFVFLGEGFGRCSLVLSYVPPLKDVSRQVSIVISLLFRPM